MKMRQLITALEKDGLVCEIAQPPVSAPPGMPESFSSLTVRSSNGAMLGLQFFDEEEDLVAVGKIDMGDSIAYAFAKAGQTGRVMV